MREMYCVTYQYHDKSEKFHVDNTLVVAETIVEAATLVAEVLDARMEDEGWSDYNVTGVNIVPELH